MARKIYEQYSDLFQHTIKVDSSVSPVVHPPRKVPVSLKEKIKEELDRVEKAEVVVKQKEHTDWVKGMVAVEKTQQVSHLY